LPPLVLSKSNTRQHRLSGPADPPLLRRLGELRWCGSGRDTSAASQWWPTCIGTPPATASCCSKPTQSFPTAIGAHHPAGSHTWVTEVDGVVLLAASRLGLDIRGHEGSP
jgi:hypothetical protein